MTRFLALLLLLLPACPAIADPMPLLPPDPATETLALPPGPGSFRYTPLAGHAGESATHAVLSTKNGPRDTLRRVEVQRRRLMLDPTSFPEILQSNAEKSRLAILKREAATLANSRPPRSLSGLSDMACTAVGVYHEARGESSYGQKAVASVILQRARVPGRWGSTPCEVLQPVQFSFLTKDRTFAPITDIAAWKKAVDASARILAEGPLPDIAGADHYHTTQVRPRWRTRVTRIARIGRHIFYRDPLSAR